MEKEPYWIPRKSKDRMSADIRDYNKKKESLNKCEGCHTTLKNPRKYYVGKFFTSAGGRWAAVKTCKRCKTENVPEMGK